MSDYFYLKDHNNKYLEVTKDQYISSSVRFLYAFVNSENYSISSFYSDEGKRVREACERWFPDNCKKDTYLTCVLIKSESPTLNDLSEQYLIKQKDVSPLDIQNLPQQADDILFLRDFLDKIVKKEQRGDKNFRGWIDEVCHSINLKWDRVTGGFAFFNQELISAYQKLKNGKYKIHEYTENEDLQSPLVKYGAYSHKGFVHFDFDTKMISQKVMLKNATLFNTPEEVKRVFGIMGSYVVFSVDANSEKKNNLKIVSVSEFQSKETRSFIAKVEKLDIQTSSLPRMKELVSNAEEKLLSQKVSSPIKTL